MKKKLPLSLLLKLNPLLEENADIIRPVSFDYGILYLKDKDPESQFFFQVLSQENNDIEAKLNYKFIPESSESNIEGYRTAPFDVMLKDLMNWLKIIRKYNEAETFFDDPFIKSYEKQFTDRFNLVDEDADIVPFNLDQQLYLDSYLANVEEKIENYKVGKTKDEIKDLSQLKSEAIDIRRNVGKLTKRKLLNKLVKFWANTQKFSLQLLKEVVLEASKEITKVLITGGIY